MILRPSVQAKRITGGRRLRSKISIDSNVGQCHYRARQSIASVRSAGAAGRPCHRIAGNHFVALLLHFNPEAKTKLRETREESQEYSLVDLSHLEPRRSLASPAFRHCLQPSREDSYQALPSAIARGLVSGDGFSHRNLNRSHRAFRRCSTRVKRLCASRRADWPDWDRQPPSRELCL